MCGFEGPFFVRRGQRVKRALTLGQVSRISKTTGSPSTTISLLYRFSTTPR